MQEKYEHGWCKIDENVIDVKTMKIWLWFEYPSFMKWIEYFEKHTYSMQWMDKTNKKSFTQNFSSRENILFYEMDIVLT